MSFTCSICGKPQSPRTKLLKVTMVERNVLYQVKPKTAKKLGLSTKFPFTKGREIVKEVDACGECGESARFHRIRIKNYKKDKRVYHDTVQEATPLN